MSLATDIRSGNVWPPFTIYVDMDDVLCAYSHAHAKALQAKPLMPFPQSQYGFFLQLETLPGG